MSNSFFSVRVSPTRNDEDDWKPAINASLDLLSPHQTIIPRFHGNLRSGGVDVNFCHAAYVGHVEFYSTALIEDFAPNGNCFRQYQTLSDAAANNAPFKELTDHVRLVLRKLELHGIDHVAYYSGAATFRVLILDSSLLLRELPSAKLAICDVYECFEDVVQYFTKKFLYCKLRGKQIEFRCIHGNTEDDGGVGTGTNVHQDSMVFPELWTRDATKMRIRLDEPNHKLGEQMRNGWAQVFRMVNEPKSGLTCQLKISFPASSS